MLAFFLFFPIMLSGYFADESISGYAGPPDTRWTLATIDDQQPEFIGYVMFPSEGRVTGQGPCHDFSARQTAPYPWIEITGFTSETARCDAPVGDDPFVRLLQGFVISEVSGPVMILTNEDGVSALFRAE